MKSFAKGTKKRIGIGGKKKKHVVESVDDDNDDDGELFGLDLNGMFCGCIVTLGKLFHKVTTAMTSNSFYWFGVESMNHTFWFNL